MRVCPQIPNSSPALIESTGSPNNQRGRQSWTRPLGNTHTGGTLPVARDGTSVLTAEVLMLFLSFRMYSLPCYKPVGLSLIYMVGIKTWGFIWPWEFFQKQMELLGSKFVVLRFQLSAVLASLPPLSHALTPLPLEACLVRRRCLEMWRLSSLVRLEFTEE